MGFKDFFKRTRPAFNYVLSFKADQGMDYSNIKKFGDADYGKVSFTT